MSRHYLEDFNQDKFTAEVRTFMKRHNITTRQFTKVLKTPYTSFCRIERKEHGMTIKTAQSLLNAMLAYKPPQRRIASLRKS